MLRDIQRGDPQVKAVQSIIGMINPDILVLSGIDHDFRSLALSELNAGLAAPFAHWIGLPGNAGIDTGRDINGNGRLGEPRDMQAYGRFVGQGALAVLSRFAIDTDAVWSLNALLWRDVPETLATPDAPETDVQRLSSGGHWVVPIALPSGQRMSVLAFHATPPVFDGPEDRNGRRNHDEIALWGHLLDGSLPATPPTGPFVIAGDANADPNDGDSRRQAIKTLLSDRRITDPKPASPGAAHAANAGQKGPPDLDTVDWNDPSPGNLRVDYVLPSTHMPVLKSGVVWPADNARMSKTVARASRHRMVWVDVDIID